MQSSKKDGLPNMYQRAKDINIYYFTGTGNSLAVARKIGNELEGKLLSIPLEMKKETISIKGDLVGVVFPVYHKSLPLIIKKFIEKAQFSCGYLFSVLTYGDTPGLANKHLKKLLQKKSVGLNSGFGVQMPYNYISPSLKIKGFYDSFSLRQISKERQQKIIRKAEQIIGNIIVDVKNGKTGKYINTWDPMTRLADSLDLNESMAKSMGLKIAGIAEPTELSFIESRQLMDHGSCFSS